MKKLSTKLEFKFENHEDIPVFNVDMKLKTRKKVKNIKIEEYRPKKKVLDTSTKLF